MEHNPVIQFIHAGNTNNTPTNTSNTNHTIHTSTETTGLILRVSVCKHVAFLRLKAAKAAASTQRPALAALCIGTTTPFLPTASSFAGRSN
jgi:hypothetical protein